MARFEKELFQDDGEYVHYMHNGERKFVGRFKRGGKGTFLTFLKKNFTPDEYFTALETSAPLTVLETRGYMSPNAKKACRLSGYPETREGYKAMIKASVEATMNRLSKA